MPLSYCGGMNNFRGKRGKGNHHGKGRREPFGGGTADQLIEHLHKMDGSSYGAYKQLVGAWDYGDFVLHIERVQSDPYAPPSTVRAEIPAEVAGLPDFATASAHARLAAADYFHRDFSARIRPERDLRVAYTGQTVLNRGAVTVNEDGSIQMRFQVQFAARGRRILGHAMANLVDGPLPDSVLDTIDFASDEAVADEAALKKHVESVEDWFALQQVLKEKDLLAFIADDSILARASGVDEHPMENAVATKAPETLALQVVLPHAGKVRGMALRPGVTLIVGGGYHGKSTLLDALMNGVYPHIPGDGRELVATTPLAVAVRAEDGRAVTGVDVSAFISNLPSGGDTSRFTSPDASGSTSQAAAIAEAVEAGSNCLLIDEDTSATNLMIRDLRMRQLVPDSGEPITPLVDRIRGLVRRGVSSIAVMGGSGDYLDRADTVICMDNYVITDVTEKAKKIVQDAPRQTAADLDFPEVAARKPLANPYEGDRGPKVRGNTSRISLDRQDIDITALEQVVEAGQADAIGWSLRKLQDEVFNGERTLKEAVDYLWEKEYSNGGLDALRPRSGFLAEPRTIDIIAAANRMRWLRLNEE